jgi:hypothetical protein
MVRGGSIAPDPAEFYFRAENSTADTCDAPVVRAGTGTISYRPYRYSGQSRIDAKNSRSTHGPPWRHGTYAHIPKEDAHIANKGRSHTARRP